jgi:predicted RNase H-like HicB family nuclease
MAMRERVNLTYDKEYRGYVADVPSLPGCMTQGKTI